MRDYELITVMSPLLSQEESGSTWERINSLITQDGGEITHEEQWGMRNLAYPIRKVGHRFLEGNYRLTRFLADGENIRQVEGFLRLSENILRYLLVKAELPIMPPPPVAEEVAEEPVAEVEEPEVKEVTEEPVAEVEEPEVEEVTEEPVAEVEEPEVEEVAEEPVAEVEEPEVEEVAEEPVAEVEEPEIEEVTEELVAEVEEPEVEEVTEEPVAAAEVVEAETDEDSGNVKKEDS